MVSRDTHIFTVKAFDYVTRSKAELFKNEYAGKRWLIRNVTSNCIKAIEPSTLFYLEIRCEEKDYRDPRLRQWRQVPIQKVEQEVSTQYFDAFPNVLVYCWPRKITIFKVTQSCPLYPFALPASSNFSTSDNVLVHSVRKTKLSTDQIIETNIEIGEAHLEPMPDHANEMWAQMDQLIKEQSERLAESTSLKIDDHYFSYRTITIVLTTSVSTVVIMYGTIKILVCVLRPRLRIMELRRRTSGMEMGEYGSRINRMLN